jgi:hypothetical protein
VNDDPRYDRRNYPGWRKVRAGLLLLLIALAAELARGILYAVRIRFPGLDVLLVGLQVLPGVGYLLCTFVPLPGWPKRLAVVNLGLAVLLLAWQAFLLLSAAQASDPRKIEREAAKFQEQIQADQEQIQADWKAREGKLKEALKGANSPDTRKRLFDDLNKETQERLDRTSKETTERITKEANRQINRAFWRLRVGLTLRPLLWCLQVVTLAYFLRGVAHFFKAYDLDNSCVVLTMVALAYVTLVIPGSLVVFQSWRPNQSESRFLNPYSLGCFLFPLSLTCLLLQVRLLTRIRRAVEDYLPR